MATASLSEMIAAPSQSLVKYETPTLVTNREAFEKGIKKDIKFPSIQEKSSSARSKRGDANKSKEHQVAEILDTILPPREFEEDGKLWIQPVSRTPATRVDVVNLAEKLDSKLLERHAREIGICPIRRELYDQCFDELIRQETLNCVERGLLFVRVRDELRMTLAAYETLYESGVAFGIRKSLMSEKGKMDVIDKLEFLTAENEDLRKQLKHQEAKYALMQREWEQKREAETRELGARIELLQRANSQLKAQLEAIAFSTDQESLERALEKYSKNAEMSANIEMETE